MTKKISYGVTGLSIGNFDYSNYSNAFTYWIENANFFYARDNYTASQLNNISKSNKVISSVDVVFANQYLNSLSYNDDGRIGINIRELPYKDLTCEFQYKKCEYEINKLKNVIIIPDQHDSFNKMKITSYKVYSPANVTDLLQQISYSIAMRYHVILVMGIFGKVSIPIAYCQKVKRLSEQLGINNLVLNIHDFDKLHYVIDHYIQNSDKYKTVIKNNVKQLRKRALLMFDEVNKIIIRSL